jgi:uncharacterized phage protein (TIGR01671 family)
MREIKFRGQHIDTKEWVYGDLVQVINHPTGLKAYIAADGDTKLFYPGCRFCEINPETIGQFTGLHDKNGMEIYEGDIIELVNADYETVRVVCEFGTARRQIFENVVDIVGFYFKLPNGKKSFPIASNYAGKHDLELFEVIGNIHDNKETYND